LWALADLENSIVTPKRNENEVTEKPLKTPKFSTLTPEKVSASRLSPKKVDACSVQEYSYFIVTRLMAW
jgi:hypothetical protein